MPILAATDFSPCSLTAVRLAAAMARRRGVSLSLVHSIEPLPVDPIATPLRGPWEAAIATSAEQALSIQADDLRKTGLAVEVQVQFGSPAGNILEAAREKKPELIVLGTHGRQGAARLFLGSCAERVVRVSPCPVLVTGTDATGLRALEWNPTAPPGHRYRRLARLRGGLFLGPDFWVHDLERPLARARLLASAGGGTLWARGTVARTGGAP